MKNVRLALVAVLAMAAFPSAGCIFVDDDEPSDPVVSDAVFRFSWTLTDNAGPTTCAEYGADKTSFLFTRLSDNMGFDELFDCADGAGDTSPLSLGAYNYVPALLDCPDATPGCPGSTTIVMSDGALPIDTNTCDSIVEPHCIVAQDVNFNL